jgi:hypothetical protein
MQRELTLGEMQASIQYIKYNEYIMFYTAIICDLIVPLTKMGANGVWAKHILILHTVSAAQNLGMPP